MDEKEKAPIPYFVHEGNLTMLNIINKRLWYIIILLIVLLFGSNFAWVIYESSFVDSVEIEQDAEWETGTVVLNGTGEVSVSGTSEAEGNKNP